MVGGLALASAAAGAAAPRSARTGCDPQVNLSRWTDARLAAQTVVVPSQAGQVAATAPLIRTGFGGILLFGTSAPTTLGSTLADLRSSTPQDLGMFVMTDEEGGGVLTHREPGRSIPMGSNDGVDDVATQITALAARVGAQLLRAGVNMDLAPVLDVDGRDIDPGADDPDGYRSFSGSAPTVITDGNAFAKGLEAAHVSPVVKHFPGLGGSTGNTDDGPARTLPWSTLKAGALHTFESAINRGVPSNHGRQRRDPRAHDPSRIDLRERAHRCTAQLAEVQGADPHRLADRWRDLRRPALRAGGGD